MVNFHCSEGTLSKSITYLELYHFTPLKSATNVGVLIVGGGISYTGATGVVCGVGSGTGAFSVGGFSGTVIVGVGYGIGKQEYEDLRGQYQVASDQGQGQH